MVSLSKEEAIKKIDLRKQSVVSLAKKTPILNGAKVRVALVLDFSGSMSRMFDDGTVQSVIERIIPLALCFDDNGELDFWIFESGFKRLEGITLDTFYGLADKIYNQYSMGGTNYAPVMQDVLQKYIVEEPAALPNYVLFMTDGDNSDHSATEKVIKEASNYPVFWQYVGLGSSNFSFLQSLDDMDGRYVDNADFFSVKRINDMSDDDLYAKLLDEFPGWLADNKVQGMLTKAGSGELTLDEAGATSDSPKKKGLFGGLFGK